MIVFREQVNNFFTGKIEFLWPLVILIFFGDFNIFNKIQFFVMFILDKNFLKKLFSKINFMNIK